MSDAERRLSVQEKIEQLEKSKVTLHPPIFDSQINMSVEKKSPDAESNALETQKNEIQVIQTNDADNLKVEVNFGTDNAVEKEKEQTIEVTTEKIDKSKEKEKDNEEKETINDEKDISEGSGTTEREIDKDADTEKDKDSQIEKQINDETTKGLQSSKTESSRKDEELPLVPLKDEEIDEIVARYPKLHNDPVKLQKLLDFFFEMDKPRYGYFTCQMLAYRLRRDGYFLPDEEVARIFVDLDSDRDSLVSLDEYLTEMSKNSRRRLSEDELRKGFTLLDADNDGFLTREDIRNSLKKMNVEEPRVFYIEDLFSWDKTGRCEKLDFEDFRFAYKKGPGSTRRFFLEEDWFADILKNRNDKLSKGFLFNLK